MDNIHQELSHIRESYENLVNAYNDLQQRLSDAEAFISTIKEEFPNRFAGTSADSEKVMSQLGSVPADDVADFLHQQTDATKEINDVTESRI